MSSDADQINESAPIRARSILPARRQDIELHTADGLTLVGELARPLDRPPVATLITLHPLPTHGGFMDSHLYKKAAFRLPALADLAIVRFNTRGTESGRGASQGNSTTPTGNGTTSPRPSSTPSSTICHMCGWWAGPSVQTLSSCTAKTRRSKVPFCSVRRFGTASPIICRPGHRGQAGARAGAGVRHLPAAAPGPGTLGGDSPGPGRLRGGCEAPVGGGDPCAAGAG